MSRSLAVLLLAAVALYAVDVGAAESIASGFLDAVKAIARAAQIAAIGFMLAAVVYYLFIAHQPVSRLLSSWWFLLPLIFVVVAVVLNIAAIISPEFRPIYEAVKQGTCPFLYCP